MVRCRTWKRGLYDLRLKISTDGPLFHIQEFLSTKMESDRRPSGEKLFDYVDPATSLCNGDGKGATQHLRRIGAWLRPVFKKCLLLKLLFPRSQRHHSRPQPEANRSDAIKSACRKKRIFSQRHRRGQPFHRRHHFALVTTGREGCQGHPSHPFTF